MPCYHPLQAWPGEMNCNGKRPLVFRRPGGVSREVMVPCGSCVGCRLERARQWAMRCRDEAKMHERNCFVTLTYDEAHLPKNSFLDKRVMQLFMKRVRKFGGEGIRFFGCGEYGSLFGRPHYHLLLFGFDFSDKKFLKETGSGEKIYTSADLGRLWPFGYSSVGAVTFGSAGYVARYALKKIGDRVSDDHFVDKSTGELRPPEFVLMSRRPGIGRSFYEKFSSDMFPSDFRVVDGVKSIPSRYYGSIYELTNPFEFATLKELRRKRGRKWMDGLDDNDSIRLAVKEDVKLAQVRNLKRSLEGNI